MDSSNQNTSAYPRSKLNLTEDQRQAIFAILLMKSEGGKLKRGCIKYTAAMFSVDRQTIRRVWQRGNASMANGLPINVCSKKPKAVGRKRIEIDVNEFVKIDRSRRTNIRSLSSALSVPRSVVHRRIKEGVIKPHTNALKPYLNEANKTARLKFCVSMLEPGSLESQPMFKNMYDYVHIDEKWFYMSKESERYYLLPTEDEPLRTCKSKRFITKVMFLAAVARPRFDAYGNEVFSGKIGIFPFTMKEPAKRSSKNRGAGTLETKAIVSVTKDISRSCLIERVLPVIRSKWPRCNATDPIYIQQDNARPHVHPSDPAFVEATAKDGFDLRLSYQPPQSPDMNVLDLGYFRAIQSLQHQEAPKSIDELVYAIEKSFEELSSDCLNRVFLSWQACMIEVMKVNGGNNYKLPHIGKSQLLRDGSVIFALPCERQILENPMVHLQE